MPKLFEFANEHGYTDVQRLDLISGISKRGTQVYLKLTSGEKILTGEDYADIRDRLNDAMDENIKSYYIADISNQRHYIPVDKVLKMIDFPGMNKCHVTVKCDPAPNDIYRLDMSLKSFVDTKCRIS